MIEFATINEHATIPQYSTNKSAGVDLRACLVDSDGAEYTVSIAPGERAIIPTGLRIVKSTAGQFTDVKVYGQHDDGLTSLPVMLSNDIEEVQIRSRSGMAAKNGVFVLNSPGTIDEDYEQEIKIILFNTDREKYFDIRHGDRIAQAILAKVGTFAGKTERPEVAREGGFGSTGVK